MSVGDTGGGIPETILGEVFNPFFTTKEAGTGLGLTLVRRIARAHGGQVDVDNRPGRGVTFRIRLPMAGATPPVAESAVPACSSMRCAPPRSCQEMTKLPPMK